MCGGPTGSMPARGQYLVLPHNEDDFEFEERFMSLKRELTEQLRQENRPDKGISRNLDRVMLP